MLSASVVPPVAAPAPGPAAPARDPLYDPCFRGINAHPLVLGGSITVADLMRERQTCLGGMESWMGDPSIRTAVLQPCAKKHYISQVAVAIIDNLKNCWASFKKPAVKMEKDLRLRSFKSNPMLADLTPIEHTVQIANEVLIAMRARFGASGFPEKQYKLQELEFLYSKGAFCSAGSPVKQIEDSLKSARDMASKQNVVPIHTFILDSALERDCEVIRLGVADPNLQVVFERDLARWAVSDSANPLATTRYWSAHPVIAHPVKFPQFSLFPMKTEDSGNPSMIAIDNVVASAIIRELFEEYLQRDAHEIFCRDMEEIATKGQPRPPEQDDVIDALITKIEDRVGSLRPFVQLPRTRVEVDTPIYTGL